MPLPPEQQNNIREEAERLYRDSDFQNFSIGGIQISVVLFGIKRDAHTEAATLTGRTKYKQHGRYKNHRAPCCRI